MAGFQVITEVATDDSSWRDLIKPSDPRYQSWLLFRSLLQAEHSAASTDFLIAFEKNGAIQRADVLKFIKRKFDAFGRGIAANVTDTVSAEKAARALDELPGRCLEDFSQWFQSVEAITGIAAASLEAETKLILTTRSEVWKNHAFVFGLEGEISKAKKAEPESSPVSRCAWTSGTGGAVTESEQPATTPSVNPGRKRGPTPDPEMALKVAEVVARVAPDGNWRQKFDDVCEALDEAVSIPKVWRAKDKSCRTWSDQLDRGLKVKAIEYRLRSANVLKKTTPGTFS